MKKHQEVISYLFFGVLTTAVNYACYYTCTLGLNINYIESNVIAWIISVLFAFVTNKSYVFQKKNNSVKETFHQLLLFVLARITTLIFETFTMFLLVSIVKMDDSIVKLFTGMMVVILNYFFSKFIVFNKVKQQIGGL